MGDRIEILRTHNINEWISKMSENIISHGQGLRELATEFPKDGKDRHIIWIKEFRDDFNPHATGITKNSVNFHT